MTKARTRSKPRLKRSLIFGIVIFVLFAAVYYLHIAGGFGPLYFGPKYQWKPEYGELNGPDISATNAKVLAKLREKFLFPPANKDKQYNLTEDWQTEPSMGQSQVIRKIFKNQETPGFFIECGALDGETRSNTLYLERYKSWSGLLIEADPNNFLQLQWKNRKSWISPTCLSTKPYPTMVSFEQKENQGKIASYGVGFVEKGFVDVQCFPFESFMQALNITTVDYFSLDVEGAELEILKTISFDKFDIRTLSVEFIHDVEGKEAIRDFMETKGYFMQIEVTHPNWLANDFIFIKSSFFETLSAVDKAELQRDREHHQTGSVF